MHGRFGSPYEFYRNTAGHITAKGKSLKGMSADDKYLLMVEMANGDKTAVELLRYDYMKSSVSRNLPDFLGRKKVEDTRLFDFLRQSENIEKHLPGYAGMTAKKIFKKCAVDQFDFPDGRHTYLFDYGGKDVVTGLYPAIEISI